MWVLAITPIAQGVPDHQPPPTFRSALDMVTIHASVRDRQGRLITGLTPSDFEIRDNGQIRPILSLRSDRDSPISLAFVVDMSGSMRLSGKIAMAREAYRPACLSCVRVMMKRRSSRLMRHCMSGAASHATSTA